MRHPRPGARSHRNDEHGAPALFTRRHLLFAGVAVTATVGYAAVATDRRPESGADPSAPTPPTRTPATAAQGPDDAIAVAQPPVTTASTVPPLTHDLVEGMVGGDVEQLQTRLTQLRFDPGPIDGILGDMTVRSVWAFEKIVIGTPRAEMRGVVTPDMWERMHGDIVVAPRRAPGGTHMEVYLPQQVSVLFIDGQARVISHVSSGEGVEWCDVVEIDLDDGTTEEKGICGISVTPGGVYHFERKVEGWRNAKLGRLYNPIYFNYGIAIHGAGNVPEVPASRGCVRHPMHIADYLPDLIDIGDQIYVFDGVEEPETYGAQPMIFDYPDPEWIPPTTSTTTTTTTTTTVPAPTTTHPHPPTSTTTTATPTSVPGATGTATTSTTAASTTTVPLPAD